MEEIDWNEKAKRLLKSELVRRGINTEDLVSLLEDIHVFETKSSIDSKISRGTFSAAFLIQVLNAIGCQNFFTEVEYFSVSEPIIMYKSLKKKPNQSI
ncbi:MAG: hypothetical protein RIR11_1748 [Bacteroidota bacterium]|jgi:hypothetical protein